jgi:anti-anti-sigma factor
MPLEITVDQQSDVQVVTLGGRLDSASASMLHESLDSVISSSGRHVVVDCSALRYVSSVGLGVFVSSGKALQSTGRSLGFTGLNQHVRSVFEMVGFFKIFSIYPSLPEAVHQLRQRASETPKDWAC